MENTENKQINTNKTEALNKALDAMLQNEYQDPNLDCTSGVCIIKGDKSLVERINKKIITEDGRQLLF
jgi:hypothetical protein